MTQMGFVASVEHAPAVIEADIRDSHMLSGIDCQLRTQRHAQYSRTHSWTVEVLRPVIHSHVDGPRWDISEQHRPETSIHAPHAIFSPYHTGSSYKPIVDGACRSR